jgi:hypothetical protein
LSRVGLLADDLDAVDARIAGIRRDVADCRYRAGELRGRGTQLVALDLGRVLIALGAADLALDRARRHTRLEEAS